MENKLKPILNLIYSYRILISSLLFAILVFFKIHGSSIGIYNEYFQNNQNQTLFSKPIIGTNKYIRKDEYSLHTIMALSQKYNNYSIENKILRAEPTNMATVYNQPVKDLFSIVKPFYWGYFILDSERGLSWFWCGRTIFLFLLTFEFFQIITRKNKLLSFFGSIMVTYSPGIQWWFAVNDLVEIIFWGELGIICIYYFFKNNKIWQKTILSFVLGLCISGYILCFYPAWQVPFGYIFTAIAFYYIFKNKQNLKKSDIFYLILSCIVSLIIIYSLIIQSSDALNLIKNTIYPGQRFSNGGKFYSVLYSYLISGKIFSYLNICELSHFFGFFPLPIILSVFYLIKSKFKDKLILILVCIELFIVLFLSAGFPEFLSKITLMKYTMERAVMASSFIDLIILIRLLSLREKFVFGRFNYKLFISFSYAYLCTIQIYSLKKYDLLNFLNNGLKENLINLYPYFIFIFCILISYVIIYSIENKYKIKNIFIFSLIFLSLILNGLVNPVVKGLDCIYKSDLGNEIQRLEKENSGIWFVSFNTIGMNNYPVIYGAATINSTNIYPNFNFFNKLDSKEKYKNVYNRFSNIYGIISYSNKETTFNILSNMDIFMELSIYDLPKTNIKYILQLNDYNYESYFPFGINIKKIYENGIAKIYYVEYFGEAEKIRKKYN